MRVVTIISLMYALVLSVDSHALYELSYTMNHYSTLQFAFLESFYLFVGFFIFFFFSSRRRHTRYWRDWSSDVCSSDLDGVGGLAAGVLVARPSPDALVAAGAEGPAAVARRRAVAGQQHAADVGGLARVVERPVQLVDGARAEGVAHLGPVERDPHGAGVDGAVVGDVGEVEPGHGMPGRGVEELGRCWGLHGVRPYARPRRVTLLARFGTPRNGYPSTEGHPTGWRRT